MTKQKVIGSIYLGTYRGGESRLSWRIDCISPDNVKDDSLVAFGLRLAELTISLNDKIKQLEAAKQPAGKDVAGQ
jgi:hypothetical protein